MVQGDELVEVVHAAARGDRRAQSRLVATYTPLARSTAARLVNDSHAVDDVVQDAFVEVFATLGTLRHPEAIPAWIRLAVRKHADRHRRRHRPAAPIDETVLASSPGADHQLEQLATVEQVRLALSTIRDADRRLLELRKRLHDARRRLRPALHDLTDRKDSTMTDYEAFLGRLHRPGDLRDIEDAPAVARPATRRPIDTGLKILDTIAPIALGGTVEMVGPAGTGHLVLVIELSYRLNRTEREAAIVAVASSQQSVGAWSNLAKLVTEPHEHDRHAVILSDDDAAARVALRDGDRLARGLANAGTDVLLVVDKATANAVGGSAALKDLAGLSPGGGSITMILVDPYQRDNALPPDAGLETRLVFSVENLTLGVFPALDPIESRSSFDNTEIADEVRALLRASSALRRYFNQPMVVAEDHTGEAPTWVDRADAERELRALVDARG